MNTLHGAFVTVLNMSITASYVAAGVMLVRAMLRRSPKMFSYVLWSVVLFRLFCPMSIALPFSLLGLLTTGANAPITEHGPQYIGPMQVSTLSSGITFADSTINQSYANPMQSGVTLVAFVWLAGILLLLAQSALSYAKTRRRLHTATLIKENIYQSEEIDTAFVFGFIRPRIYIPAGIAEADLNNVLAHERTHIRRLDHLIKPCAFLALVLHWFNPLMWLSFTLMSKDMEMSCDEAVLGRMDEGAKIHYSSSLLSLSRSRSRLVAVLPLAFGESSVKARIRNALNYKKPGFWMGVASLVVVSAVVLAFAVNPQRAFNNDEVLSPIASSGTGGLTQVTKSTFTPTVIELVPHTRLPLPLDQEITLPDFAYSGTDLIEKLVYDTEMSRNAQPKGFTVVGPKIHGFYEEDNLLKVFTTTYRATYRLYGNMLDLEEDTTIRAAITYRKNSSGYYELLDYTQAKTGFVSEASIKAYCTMPVSGKEIKGLADRILIHYGNRDIHALQKDNLYRHLQTNGVDTAKVISPYGEFLFRTRTQ